MSKTLQSAATIGVPLVTVFVLITAAFSLGARLAVADTERQTNAKAISQLRLDLRDLKSTVDQARDFGELSNRKLERLQAVQEQMLKQINRMESKQ